MTAEEYLSDIQHEVRRLKEDTARIETLGKWPDGMPRGGQSCDMLGMMSFLDDQKRVSADMEEARAKCHELDDAYPRSRWGRILECYYVDDLPIKDVAEIVGYVPDTVKHKKAEALDVMTDYFFSPRVETRHQITPNNTCDPEI
jgi:hypothetical protein